MDTQLKSIIFEGGDMAEPTQNQKIKGYLELLRPGWWLACFFIGLTPGILAIYWHTDSLDEFFQFKTIIWAFAYWASIVGIYVFNDMVGDEEDSIINPKRPIPAKVVSQKEAGILSVIFIGLGVGLWWFTFQNPLSTLVQITCIALIAIYSAVYKNNILLGLGAGLIPVGVWIALAPFSMITVALFFLVFFWEMTLDVPENLLHYEGDLKSHPHTFAITMGREKFAQIGLIFAIPTVAVSIWLFILLEFSFVFLFFAVIAGLFLLHGINSIRDNLKPMYLGRSLGLAMLFIFIINIGLITHTLIQNFL
jgi:4-hydroxybenzoate polyprenyltransferase